MSVSRRKALGAIVVVSVLLVGSYFLLPYLPFGNGLGQTEEEVIEPHPFNDLNWWDLPWELATQSDLLEYVVELAKHDTRHMLTEPEEYYAAAEFISGKLQNLGLETWYEGEHESLLAVKRGFGIDDRAIVFSAYLDTEIDFQYTVNFNTGSAGMLATLAEMLSNYRFPFDVYFAFPAYSKSGTYLPNGDLVPYQYGAQEISEYLIDNGVDVIALYDFEGLMFSNDGLFLTADLSIPYPKGVFLAELLQAFALRGGFSSVEVVGNDFDITDQGVYLSYGFPAIHVEGRDLIDPDNPPVDAVYSDDYRLDHVLAIAKACASLTVFLAYSGNGEDIHEKLVTVLEPYESVVDWKMLTVSSPLSVDIVANSSATIKLDLQNIESNTIDSLTISGQETSGTLSDNPGTGIRRVLIRNIGNESIKATLYFSYQFDFDWDSVPDSEEYTWPEPDPPLDWDHDSLSDAKEVEVGTDIFIADTDSDSMIDGYEYAFGLDPLHDDTMDDLDGDGLTNIREHQLGTFPNSTDTDQDAMDDFWEVLFLTDPLVDDSQLDPDNDTLTNLEEYQNGADPYSADGDFDGVPDVIEVSLGMDALSPDSDGDGLRDQLELIEGLDPLRPDYDIDIAPDGYDHNPRINALLVILGIAFLPVLLGGLYFWRRLQ